MSDCFKKRFGGLLLLLYAFLLPATRPNVLLITIDTWRADRFSFLNDKFVRTPELDKLAASSIVFVKAFAHNPCTLPSHTNILTGTTPLFHGISDNTGFRLSEKFLTLTELLKSNGYKTAAFIGAFPLDSRFGLNQGFDLYDDYYGTHNELEFFYIERRAEKVVQLALDWLKKNDKESWFVWVHIFDPHQPYLPPEPFNHDYSSDLYSGEVAYADQQLGKLFSLLREKNLLKNTVIVVTGDHGEALGEKGEQTHSYFAYNNTLHVPLILYYPGVKPQMSRAYVAHIDIFPTICDLLKLKKPDHLQGESLFKLMSDESYAKKRSIYFESLTAYLNRDWAPLRGVIKDGYKYIDLPIVELYDLEKDFGEEENLASGSGKIGFFKNELINLMKKLKGSQTVNRADTISGEDLKKLRSLGYISENIIDSERKRNYTRDDDLKVLLPLQNQLLDGVNQFQLGNHSRGEELLLNVIERSPGFILAYNHLITMYVQTGKINQALKILESGLKKNPGNIRLLIRLGQVLSEKGDQKGAIEVLESCLQKVNNDPDLFNFLGIAYFRRGDGQNALRYYQQGLTIDNNNASILNNIGSVYLQSYLKTKSDLDLDIAEKYFKQAITADSKHFPAYNGLGGVYKKKGLLDQALKNWRKAYELKNDYDYAIYNLATTYLEIRDYKQALFFFEKYYQLFEQKMPAEEKQKIREIISRLKDLQ